MPYPASPPATPQGKGGRQWNPSLLASPPLTPLERKILTKKLSPKKKKAKEEEVKVKPEVTLRDGLIKPIAAAVFENLDERDLCSFMGVSTWARRLVAGHWRDRMTPVFERMGLDDPPLLLNELDRLGAMVSGPDVLNVVRPGSVPKYHFWSRLELHIASDVGNERKAQELLESMGFVAQREWREADDIRYAAWQWLGYSRLDITARRVVQMEKAHDRYIFVKAYIIVSKHWDSPLLTVLSQPTTAFMNAISSDAIHVLYPILTFAGKGLVNGTTVNGIPTRLRDFDGPMLSLQDSLNKWDEYAKHRCGQDLSCPFKMRSLLDGLIMTAPITHQDDPFRIPKKSHVVPELLWRLRSAPTCGDRLPCIHEQVVGGRYAFQFGWIDDLPEEHQDHHAHLDFV
ncbi:hypothetical protein DFP72DRAFT_1072186 [Ephemerocybe angulata]|uniref:F-box domain-containing protein n=1 Tax=Ephemerocybe angulata TaxID=980116 RepID=A0A8H6LU38_9AGAR|nr:hypothetical protein DFP72DRAFT_1082207 [Tulosesus angulatus]KAF6750463.1 hypothetical protein DFP72DRAFT_1072186 [Tulosesus angulatus]